MAARQLCTDSLRSAGKRMALGGLMNEQLDPEGATPIPEGVTPPY
jgi:hypothetical protein